MRSSRTTITASADDFDALGDIASSRFPRSEHKFEGVVSKKKRNRLRGKNYSYIHEGEEATMGDLFTLGEIGRKIENWGLLISSHTSLFLQRKRRRRSSPSLSKSRRLPGSWETAKIKHLPPR